MLSLLGIYIVFAALVGGAAAFTRPMHQQLFITKHQKVKVGRRQRVIIGAERKWEVLRFISQSSKFIKPPPFPLPFIGGGEGTKRIVGRGMCT